MSSIQDVRSINTPAKQYLWEVDIRALGGLAVIGNLSTYAKTVVIPQESVEIVVINFKSSKTQHAGRDASGRQATFTFWDDQQKTVFGFFARWLQLIRNPVTGGGVSRDLYAAEASVRLLADDEKTVTSEFALIRCFPTELSDVTLDYSASDAIEVSVTMSYDERLIIK